jgi:hypothetical protein
MEGWKDGRIEGSYKGLLGKCFMDSQRARVSLNEPRTQNVTCESPQFQKQRKARKLHSFIHSFIISLSLSRRSRAASYPSSNN